MSYEALQDTGLTQDCFKFCTKTSFKVVAEQVGEARTDLELAQEVGVSATGCALLEQQLDKLVNPVVEAAAKCKDGTPWRNGNNWECGRVAGGYYH